MDKINVRAPLNTFLGYGHAAYNIIKNLHPIYDISLFPISNVIRLTSESNQEDIENWMDVKKFNPQSPCLTIWHEFQLIQNHIGRGPMIGFPIWEINILDELRQNHMNYCDHLIVCSQWAKSVCDASNIKTPVSVVPFGVDRSIFHEEGESIRRDDKFKFFNIGKIEKRKGHDILHKAFAKAFDGIENVELHMFCYNPFLSEDESDAFHREYKEILGDKYHYHSPVPTDLALASSIRQFDCGVFPTRSEGFCLPILQSMSCGKPIITTNYSGHTQYCNEENSNLLPFVELEEAHDGKWFYGNSEWAKLDEDDLISALKTLYSEGPTINREGIETAKNYSWENTADGCSQCISSLLPTYS